MTADITPDAKQTDESNDNSDGEALRALHEHDAAAFMNISGAAMQDDLTRVYSILHRIGAVHKIQRLQLAANKKNAAQRGRS